MANMIDNKGLKLGIVVAVLIFLYQVFTGAMAFSFDMSVLMGMLINLLLVYVGYYIVFVEKYV